MSYFYLQSKLTSTLPSNREYYSSNKTQLKNMCSQQDNMQTLMSNIQNKNILYVNFNKHYKKRIYSYIHYTHRGYLKLNRNQFVYNTTTWNINTKNFKQNEIQKENYNLKGKIKNTTNHQITIKIKNTEFYMKH